MKRLPQWIRVSLQRQLAFAFGSITILMMLTLTGLLLFQQQKFLDAASIRRATALANGLARSSVSWVLANDIVGLEEIVQGYVDTPNLERMFVINQRGEVLASTQANEAGRFLIDAISLDLLRRSPQIHVLVANEQLIDVAAPILHGDRHVGWARIELNQHATAANLRSVAKTHLEFVIITAAMLIGIAIWLGRRLSNRLQQLDSVSRQIAEGERSLRASASAGQADEIDRLAGNINHMLDTLTRSECDLGKLNRVYAAWTECVTTIARERHENELLNRLCEILTDTIGLRLVFIGFIDANADWIKVVASSHWNLPYLKALKVSARADRPEGQGPLGKSIRQGQPEIFNDFLSRPESSPWHAAAQAESIQSVAAFPLSRSGKTVGGIAVYSSELNFFNADMIALLQGLSTDISFALDNIDREAQRQQAEIQLNLAASVFDNSQEGILITDADQIIISVNSMFSKLTGYSAEEVLGQTPRILASSLQDQLFYQAMWEQIHAQGFWQGEIVNRRKNGDLFPEWLCINRVLDAAGQVTHYVGTFIDYTEHKANEERIHKLAFYDPLTQLPNRRLLIERLRQALVTSQRNHHHGALMFLDLDRFKILNDTQGHDLGDQLLIEVGQRIADCIREQDTVARLGGDEFVIMLEGLGENQDNALAIAQRIGNKLLESLRQPYRLRHFNQEGYPLSITHHSSASIGMTLFQGSHVNCEDLLKQADVAMYQAKQSGRNKLSAFNPELQRHINQRAKLESELRQALNDRQFELYYQVQMDHVGRIIGAEALSRWHHPVQGCIAPSEFIPLAEETGLINELGLWTLTESAITLTAWAQNDATRNLTLAVNVSAKQFNQSQFVQQVSALLADGGFEPQRLKLEITESVVLTDIDEAIATMMTLRQLGLSFSMDDFGTGYSSLSYLRQLPLSQLKIDRTFVRDLATDANDAAIIGTILELGKRFGIEVVAEGVETEAQRRYLVESGCRYFQGYLFGKPEPLAAFERRLAESRPTVLSYAIDNPDHSPQYH